MMAKSICACIIVTLTPGLIQGKCIPRKKGNDDFVILLEKKMGKYWTQHPEDQAICQQMDSYRQYYHQEKI